MAADLTEGPAAPGPPRGSAAQPGGSSWRRIALLILAITIHNIPGESPPRACPARAARRLGEGLGQLWGGPFCSGPQASWHLGLFSRRPFFRGPALWGWFGDDSSASHFLCTLCLI